MKLNDDYLNDQLRMLIETHGISNVRKSLIEIDREAGQPEWARTGSPHLLVNSHGEFYWSTPERGLVSAEESLEYSRNGRPFIKINGFFYWLQYRVYRAFIGDYDEDLFTISQWDGDPSNCHVDNLFLVKRSWEDLRLKSPSRSQH